MMDRINHEWINSTKTTHIAPDDWEQEHGLLRLALEDETLWLPLENVNWIRREE